MIECRDAFEEKALVEEIKSLDRQFLMLEAVEDLFRECRDNPAFDDCDFDLHLEYLGDISKDLLAGIKLRNEALEQFYQPTEKIEQSHDADAYWGRT